jgi:hypothetical protein
MDFQTEENELDNVVEEQEEQRNDDKVHEFKYVHNETHYNTTDQLLENEKQTNQKDNWNKLDKTTKLQILTLYADSYGADKGLSEDEIKSLKRFFRDATEKGKFQKAKDVVYNRASRLIDDIPALHWNSVTNNFTLRNLDNKKVSLLKSLTPKRLTAKNNAPAKLCIKEEDSSIDHM